MFTIEGKNLMLTAFAGSAVFLGLADSNDAELTLTGYARQAIVWETAEDGSLECLQDFIFTELPVDVDIDKVIFMSAETGGTRLGEESAEAILTYTINGIVVTL